MRKVTICWRIFISILLLVLSKFIRRNETWIAFGSWKGELYIDNSRYLLETAICKYGSEFRFIWVGNDEVKKQLPNDPRVICCHKNSFYSFHYLLRCKYMFCSQMWFEDLSNYNVFSGAVITYLHHGCPLKKWGDDVIGKKSATITWINTIIRRRRTYEYFVCSSEAHFQTNLTALKSWGCLETNNLRTGTPRNDMLVTENRLDVANGYKEKYANLIGFTKEKKVVLYVPTFRRSGVNSESLVYRNDKDKKRLSELLRQFDCILIEKAHYAGSFKEENCQQYSNILSCPKNVNLQEMLLFTDCMISDYSGALLDYSILDRPILHYIYDFDFYRDVDSGLYYDLKEFQAGPAVRNFDELLCELGNCLNDSSIGSDLRKAVRTKFMEYEKGIASETILDIVIKYKK